MNRRLLIASTLVSLFAALPCKLPAQEWARKMFTVVAHDFGTVARGSQHQFAFELTNCYEEQVEIAEVRTSCGCTTPTISKRHLKTWEKGAILAKLNTKSFTGHKKATITVVINKPYPAEIQLSVSGTIRSDVVLEPWQVDFQNHRVGQTHERRIKVLHAGNPDWQIVDVRSANPHFEVELVDEERNASRVSYQMLVRLKPTAEVGYFQDQLTLVTNDREHSLINLPVQGNLVSPLTISPASLFMGVTFPGQTVTKRLVVRGAQPFRVLRVECANPGFQFGTTTDAAKRLHFIPVTFQAGQADGQIDETIRITTDLSGGLQADCKATATVRQRGE